MGEKSGTGTPLPCGLVLVPLHLRPELISSCAELLNQTWRRSLGARIHSLERSCDDFPAYLALVGDSGVPVLGHVRLCRVIGLEDSLFVESVVVCEELRGKGYGRKLMEATERYARGRGFRNMYLTTHDKQYFYSHLGYQLCEPVQNMGSLGTLVPSGMLQSMTRTGIPTTGLSIPPALANGPSPPSAPPASQTPSTSASTSKPHSPPPPPPAKPCDLHPHSVCSSQNVPFPLNSPLCSDPLSVTDHSAHPLLGPPIPSPLLSSSANTNGPFSSASGPSVSCSPYPTPQPRFSSLPSTMLPAPPSIPPYLPSTSPLAPSPPIAPPLPSSSLAGPPPPAAPPLPSTSLAGPPPAPPLIPKPLPSTNQPALQPPIPPPLLCFSPKAPPPPIPSPLPCFSSLAPPPAPLPPPLPTKSPSALSLHAAPVPPPCPPSHQLMVMTNTGQTLQSPYRDFRGQTIYWMKKCI